MSRPCSLIATAGVLAALAAAAACPGESGVLIDGGSDYRYDTGLVLIDASIDSSPSPDGPAPPADATPPADVAPPDLPATTNGDIGDPCVYNSQCEHNICAQNTHTGERFCTKICNPCAPDPCPDGSGCQNAGPAYICAPGYPEAPCT